MNFDNNRQKNVSFVWKCIKKNRATFQCKWSNFLVNRQRFLPVTISDCLFSRSDVLNHIPDLLLNTLYISMFYKRLNYSIRVYYIQPFPTKRRALGHSLEELLFTESNIIQNSLTSALVLKFQGYQRLFSATTTVTPLLKLF